MLPRLPLVLLALLGVLLSATIIPGVFTIDEDNYLVTVTALRQGRLTVPGTEGLPASSELVWFDPQAHVRRVDETPVSPTTPPLYAPLALPFSLLGWRGLVALNTLAFLVAGMVVFLFARRYGGGTAAPAAENDGENQGEDGGEAAGWIALAAFTLGSFNLEYAQGMWPHMVTVALAVAAVYLAARVRDGDSLGLSFAAGLAAGWAAGVRYQNVLLALLLGGTVFLFTSRRWRASALYAAGAALPLAACSWINHSRLGFWNPVSKGARYLSRGGDTYPHGYAHEVATMLWARLVDYAQRPTPAGLPGTYLQPHPESGVYLVGGAMKKAWLQSSPWLLPALGLLLLAWVARRAADGGGEAARRRRELRVLSLVVLPILLVFALFGANRTDGFSFNQRYFLELVPLVAVAFGWAAAPALRRRQTLLFGGLAGTVLTAAVLVRPPDAVIRHQALRWLPLLLAVSLLAAWWAARRGGASRDGNRGAGARRALALLVGASLAYGLVAHVGEDLRSSRLIRQRNLALAEAADAVLPQRAALFAIWGNKDPYGPLLLDRDLVIADPFSDRGETAPALVAALLSRGTPVYLAGPFPAPLLRAMRGSMEVRRAGPTLLEIVPPAGSRE